jgi:hypothetical protein
MDGENRGILRILGEAALEEHAGWVLLHHERAHSESNVWRMEAQASHAGGIILVLVTPTTIRNVPTDKTVR